MTITASRAAQARLYWSLMQEGISDLDAAEFRDQISVLEEYTTSDVLRTLCARNRRRFDGIINVEKMARRAR